MAIAPFVSETADSPGTGTITLLGPNLNLPCRPFSSAFVTGNVVEYVITTNTPGGQSEEAYGTYNSSTNTLSRTTVESTSGVGVAINFTGQVFVFSYPLASRLPLYDASGGLTLKGGLTSPGSISASGSITAGGNGTFNGFVSTSAHVSAAAYLATNGPVYAHNALTGGGLGMFADASIRYLRFSITGWRLQWSTANGDLNYINDSGAALWYVNGIGNSYIAGNYSIASGITYRAYAPTNSIGFGWDGFVLNGYVDGTFVGALAMRTWVASNYKPISAYIPNQNVDSNSSPTFGNPVVNGTLTSGALHVTGTGYTNNAVNTALTVNEANVANITMVNATITNVLQVVSGQAFKPGGGSWSDSSDLRIKTITEEYQPGLVEILRLRPVNYLFKGNDQNQDKGFCGHSDTTTLHIGLVAQEAEEVLPEMVTCTSGFIDGEEVDDMRILNSSCLVYVLVNAVKELHAEIQTLKGVNA